MTRQSFHLCRPQPER